MMKIIGEIRLANLELLIEEQGSADAVATCGDTSPVYLSQLRTKAVDKKTGKPREIGPKLARKLETGCKKERGWMDTPHEPSKDAVKKLQTIAQPVAMPDAMIQAQNDGPQLYPINSINQWPFEFVTHQDWMQLPAREREELEGLITLAVFRSKKTRAAS